MSKIFIILYLNFFLLNIPFLDRENKCIDLKNTHIVSINCEGINCFEIKSNCSFDIFQVDIFNRQKKQVITYSTYKENNLNELNLFMNELKYNNNLENGTYHVNLKAYNINNQDTTNVYFNFILYK